MSQDETLHSEYAVVLVPPTAYQKQFYGPAVLSPDAWTEAWTDYARKTFCKPVLVSTKHAGIPLTEAFERASYVIGFNSTALIEAAARGIFVQSTGPSPVFWLKHWYGREQWEETRYALFCEMALRQYTLEEIRDGTAHKIMSENGEI